MVTLFELQSGSPMHRENRENGKNIPYLGEHREFGNVAKTQGILFAHVVNSLILKVYNIAIFAVKMFNFF